MLNVCVNRILCVIGSLLLYVVCFSPAHAVFINEIHYDNAGSDSGEAVELAGAVGQDLTGWSLLFYNGSNGLVYKDYALSGVFSDMQQGMGVLGFSISGIQNGSPDGVALIDDAGGVQQFLSYEGSLVASDGAATGMSSTDIGVEESGGVIGGSLQLFGAGRDYADFSWGAGMNSVAGINVQQVFTGSRDQAPKITSVPEPASGMLMLAGLLLLAITARLKKNTLYRLSV